jgi:hypothetical protein
VVALLGISVEKPVGEDWELLKSFLPANWGLLARRTFGLRLFVARDRRAGSSGALSITLLSIAIPSGAAIVWGHALE